MSKLIEFKFKKGKIPEHCSKPMIFSFFRKDGSGMFHCEKCNEFVEADFRWRDFDIDDDCHNCKKEKETLSDLTYVG